MNCEEQVKTLTAEKQMLIQDTTDYGLRFRALSDQKNFIEQSSTSEITYLRDKLESSVGDIEELQAKIEDQENELSQYREGWQDRQKMLNELKIDLTKEIKSFNLTGFTPDIVKGKLVFRFQATEVFSPGTAQLLPIGHEIIVVLTDVLKDYKLDKVLIEAHTANEIPVSPNNNYGELSLNRAKSVRTLMVSEKFTNELLETRGIADTDAMASLTGVDDEGKSYISFIISSAR